MRLEIVRLEEKYFEALRGVLDVVAREKRYLAFTQAPPRDLAFEFYRSILTNELIHYLALLDEEVVGWCDILPVRGEARAHVGVLGIGLVPATRHRGIGAKLMRTAIEKAWERGLSRIELAVRTDNLNGKALYERMGFKIEGVNARAFCIDEEFHDTYAMALLR